MTNFKPEKNLYGLLKSKELQQTSVVPRSGNYSAVDGRTNLLIRSTNKQILDQKEPNSRGLRQGVEYQPAPGRGTRILGQFVKGYSVIGTAID